MFDLFSLISLYGIPEEISIKEGHSTNPINCYGFTKKAIEIYFKLINWNIDVYIFLVI